MTWSPQQYTQFEDDRTRPVRDLVAAIPGSDPARAVDLGCGPGNSTEVLAARFPGAEITGLDSSAEMVDAARQRLPGLRFDVADIAAWDEPGRYDVILSNAVLQWLTDHEALLPRLVGCLSEGGSLAVQMPDNVEEPAYQVMRAVADAPSWRDTLAKAGGKRGEMLTAGGYYALLKPYCRRVDVWRTTYFHVLAGGADAVVEWFKGSGLRPYLAPLDEAQQAEFLALYRAGVAAAYKALQDGSVLLPFPRLFIVATR
jgi:trans-aconitate 2-methyltransferase